MNEYQDSQSSIIQQQFQQPINYYIPQKKTNPGGHGSLNLNKYIESLQANCVQLMNQILKTRIQNLAQQIFDLISTNCNLLCDKNQTIIVAVRFKKCQQNQIKSLNQAIKQISQKKGEKILQKIQNDYNNINKNDNSKIDMKKQKQKVNNKQNKNSKSKNIILKVQELSKNDIKDIALQIKIKQDQSKKFIEKQKIKQINKLKQKNNNKKNNKQIFHQNQEQLEQQIIYLYLPKKVTNLCKQNISIFQNKQTKRGNIIILATNQSLKLVDEQLTAQTIIQQNQQFFFEAYNDKQLFCQFFYRCIGSRTIKAYLPKQLISLMTMYDHFPMSYKEGCKMLIYAIKICQIKRRQKNKQDKNQIQIKQLIRTFNKTWNKFFDIKNENTQKSNYQKIVGCILDQSYIYKLSESKIQLNLKRIKYSHIDQQYTIDDFSNDFLKNFQKRINQHQKLKYLAYIFNQIEEEYKKSNQFKLMKKNKNRQYLLGLKQKPPKAPKIILQEKITKIFQKATIQVRQQAKWIEWKQIAFFQTLNPEICKIIAQSALIDHQFRDVFNYIRSTSSMPVARIIHDLKSIDPKKIIYIIRCLGLKGLIELNKHSLRPSLTTNFYQKAKYQNNKNLQ